MTGLLRARFFQTPAAHRLMDASNFPPAIRDFLAEEGRLLGALADSFATLVEVGCHDGRYLTWAAARGRAYVGVDVAADGLEAGRSTAAAMRLDPERFRFVLGDARELGQVIEGVPGLRGQQVLVLLPFGLFGALEEPDSVLEGLAEASTPFVLSLYQPGHAATLARSEYYARCGLSPSVSSDARGVRVRCGESFESVAYEPTHLLARCRSAGLSACSLVWSPMNHAVLPPRLAEEVAPVLPGCRWIDAP